MATITEKEFPVPVILSITTGRMLCDFGDMHGCAEFVLGHPVWTHEFADKATWNRMKEAVFAQHPDLRECNADDVTPENVWEKVAGYVASFGERRTLIEGRAQRTEPPLESAARIMPDKPAIPVTVPDPENN